MNFLAEVMFVWLLPVLNYGKNSVFKVYSNITLKKLIRTLEE